MPSSDLNATTPQGTAELTPKGDEQKALAALQTSHSAIFPFDVPVWCEFPHLTAMCFIAGPEELTPKEDGGEEQKALAALAGRFERNEAVYSKFLAIGLFR